MSPDLILTLNRHVWPVPWVVDWITGPCLKALPTDGFSPLITENFQNTRQDINIKHVTLEIIKNWHQGYESGSQLINSENKKFQIKNNSYQWFYVTSEVSDTLPLHEVIGSELRGPFEKKKKKERNLTKLVLIKTFRPYLFLDDLLSLWILRFSPAAASNASGFSYSRNNRILLRLVS